MRVTVLGLGEAGTIYAADLARRGVAVTAVDPFVPILPDRVGGASSTGQAVSGADLVLSLVGAGEAGPVLLEALPAMQPTAIYADMNTASPAEKQRLALRAKDCAIAFVDVAILAPVPRARLETPVVLSGTGTDRLLAILTSWGIPATVADGGAGAAAGLKLLRSVFMKGLAATVFESISAARAAGAEDWIIEQIASELGPSGHEQVARILEGTRLHALRREAEMREARSFLETLGTPHPMTDGALEWLRSLSRQDPA